MLIIEGPDLVGKTTLAHALEKMWADNPTKYGPLPVLYGHFSRLPETWNYFKSYLPYITRHTIMDRFHLSELAYGSVTRGHCRIEPITLRMLEAYLTLVGSYTVVITAKPDVLKARWETKKRDEMFNLDQVLAVNEYYQTLLTRHPDAHVDLIYELDQPDEFLDDPQVMHQMLKEWSCRLSFLQGHCSGAATYYGPASPELEEVVPMMAKV